MRWPAANRWPIGHSSNAHAPSAVGGRARSAPGATPVSASQTFHDAPCGIDVADAGEHVEVGRARARPQLDPDRSDRFQGRAQRFGGVGQHVGAGLQRAVVDDRPRAPAAPDRPATGWDRRGRSDSGQGVDARAGAWSCSGRPFAEPQPPFARARAAASSAGSRQPPPRALAGQPQPDRARDAGGGRRRAAGPAARRSRRACRPRSDPGEVCVHGPMISCGSRPARLERAEVLEHPGQEDVVPAADQLDRRGDLLDPGGVVAHRPSRRPRARGWRAPRETMPSAARWPARRGRRAAALSTRRKPTQPARHRQRREPALLRSRPAPATRRSVSSDRLPPA